MAVAAAVEIKRRLQKRSGDLLIPHPTAATPCRVGLPPRRYGRLTVTLVARAMTKCPLARSILAIQKATDRIEFLCLWTSLLPFSVREWKRYPRLISVSLSDNIVLGGTWRIARCGGPPSITMAVATMWP